MVLSLLVLSNNPCSSLLWGWLLCGWTRCCSCLPLIAGTFSPILRCLTLSSLFWRSSNGHKTLNMRTYPVHQIAQGILSWQETDYYSHGKEKPPSPSPRFGQYKHKNIKPQEKPPTLEN
jgi:hypothetical protein